ncbi:SKA3 protein, partial [Zapornia atra]|nr:SKA3 protein [Zapornia atra]
MDASKIFFSKLRSLAFMLEKETRQLKRALHGEDADYEDKSPTEVVHDLHCEIRTLKENINASLRKSCWEKQAINNFIKASEILMRRSAADLGQIRELFHGCKTCVKEFTEEEEAVDSDLPMSVENKSDEACTEKPLVPKDLLQNPQLSDFGLEKYAFSRPLSASKGQHATNACQENSNIRTPLKPETPRILPKTPKCMLKMDDYECVTPRLENFGISEHTMCMNEDYTMSLIHKTAQTSQKGVKFFKTMPTSVTFSPKVLKPVKRIYFSAPTTKLRLKVIKKGRKKWLKKSLLGLCFRQVKTEVSVPEPTSRRIIVTPGPKVTPENTDWISSPMVLVFCTPDVKIPASATRTVLPRLQKTDELPLPSHTETPQVPHFEARWLTAEDKVVNTSYVHFFFTISSFSNGSLGFFSNTAFSYGINIELVTKNDATEKQCKEDKVPFAMSSDEYYNRFGDPSPPQINHYDQLLSTPPPPELTRIPDDVLQILSKYNHEPHSSKAKEMGTKAGSTTRYENDFADYCNKENR